MSTSAKRRYWSSSPGLLVGMLGGKRAGVGNAMAASLWGDHTVLLVQRRPGVHRLCGGRGHAQFLIASLVNEVAIALLFGLFGIGATLLSVGAGLIIAIVAGFVLGRLHLERWVEPFVFETRLRGQPIDSTAGLSWTDRIQMGVEEVGSILRKIWPHLPVGIALPWDPSIPIKNPHRKKRSR